MTVNVSWTGHSAILHGCTVDDEAFVGMGATLLDGVVVEKHAMVAAGALVRQNTRIPSGQVEICSLSTTRPLCVALSFSCDLLLGLFIFLHVHVCDPSYTNIGMALRHFILGVKLKI